MKRTSLKIKNDIEEAKSARESMRKVAEEGGWNNANSSFVDRCNDKIQALVEELSGCD
jgi:hypothetical protein